MLSRFEAHHRAIHTCPTCYLEFRSRGGLTQHRNSAHRIFTQASNDDNGNPSTTFEYHPSLTGRYHITLCIHVLTLLNLAKPCDENGVYLPPYARPQAQRVPTSSNSEATNPWNPFNSRVEFDFAYYHFVEAQTSAALINKALDIWAATVAEFGRDSPWANANELYATIDAIQCSDIPWKVYKIHYQGPLPPGTPPKWMTQTYELCTRDSRLLLHQQLETAHFKDAIDLSPYRQYDSDRQRIWSNLMSADWAWKQAVSDRINAICYTTNAKYCEG